MDLTARFHNPSFRIYLAKMMHSKTIIKHLILFIHKILKPEKIGHSVNEKQTCAHRPADAQACTCHHLAPQLLWFRSPQPDSISAPGNSPATTSLTPRYCSRNQPLRVSSRTAKVRRLFPDAFPERGEHRGTQPCLGFSVGITGGNQNG